MSRRRALAGFTLGASLLFAGGSPRVGADGSPVDPAGLGTAPPATVALPFDAVFAALDAFYLRLNAAQGDAIAACALKAGITGYEPLRPEAVEPIPGFGRFGLEDRTVAETSGYLVNADPSEDVGDPAAALSPEQQQALNQIVFGDNEESLPIVDAEGNVTGSLSLGDGCLRDFIESWFGDVESYSRFRGLAHTLENAREEARVSFQADEAYHRLLAEWQVCVVAQGVSIDVGVTAGPEALISGPMTARSGPDVDDGNSGSWPEPRPSEFEVRVAVADVECKESTDFVATASELLIGHEQAVADRISLSEIAAELESIVEITGP